MIRLCLGPSLCAILLAACSGHAKSTMAVHRVGSSELAAVPYSEHGSQNMSFIIPMAAGCNVPGSLDVTSKGNGLLRLLNVCVKLVDDHDDGAIYVGGALTAEFADVNSDGYRDMVVSGAVMYTDDRSGTARGIEPVLFVYTFEPRSNTYLLSIRQASFSPETGPLP